MIYFVHRLTPDVLSITSKYSISFSCASFSAPTPKRKLDATYINYHATAIKLCEHLRSLHSSLKAVSGFGSVNGNAIAFHLYDFVAAVD